jgi:hypothetical protein
MGLRKELALGLIDDGDEGVSVFVAFVKGALGHIYRRFGNISGEGSIWSELRVGF